jgi:uncharacterized membrane protein YcgQ (UPF0703/DUF1980 family)
MWRPACALLAVVVLAGCAPKVTTLVANPKKYYEQQVKIVGRVSRLHAFPTEVLLEVADAREHRILVRVPAEDAPDVDDWIEVRGVFVAELRVGDRVVYDAIAAEEVDGHRAPWLPNLF